MPCAGAAPENSLYASCCATNPVAAFMTATAIYVPSPNQDADGGSRATTALQLTKRRATVASAIREAMWPGQAQQLFT